MHSNLKYLDKNLVLGGSFSPELIKADKSLRLPALKFIVENMGIRDLRLGIRWNKVEKERGNLDIEFYKKYIDYCLDKKIKVCLNIGPIKTFRWPEEHLPDYLQNSLPPQNSKYEITLSSEIAGLALEYLDALLDKLKKEYGDKLDKMIIQPENEPFYPFGKNKMQMGTDYLLEVLRVLHKYLPNNKVMLNSAGRFNLREIINFWQEVVDNKLYKFRDLILGFNFYYKTSVVDRIPFLTAVNPLFFAPPWTLSVEQLQKAAEFHHFKLEVSEAQFESWGNQTDPGSKFGDLNYLLKQSLKIFPENQKYKLVRLWGLESFALKNLNQTCTEEEKIICDIITRFNLH